MKPSPRRHARWCAVLVVASFGFALPNLRAVEPRSIAVLDFEIEDDTAAQGAAVDVATQQRRLRMARDEIRAGLAERGAFVVVDDAPARAMIDRRRSGERLHECNGCELEIARALGAQVVLVGWVQKVSNLILNLNVGMKDVDTGKT